jgi:hypothetical protein
VEVRTASVSSLVRGYQSGPSACSWLAGAIPNYRRPPSDRPPIVVGEPGMSWLPEGFETLLAPAAALPALLPIPVLLVPVLMPVVFVEEPVVVVPLAGPIDPGPAA